MNSLLCRIEKELEYMLEFPNLIGLDNAVELIYSIEALLYDYITAQIEVDRCVYLLKVCEHVRAVLYEIWSCY